MEDTRITITELDHLVRFVIEDEWILDMVPEDAEQLGKTLILAAYAVMNQAGEKIITPDQVEELHRMLRASHQESDDVDPVR